MVWDRFIRFFHWSLAAGIVTNYWFMEGGDDLHEWLGYALAALVVARIGWGFIGPANARFTNFVTGLKRVMANLTHFADTYREHKGHSPLAGWMVLFMLLLVLALAVTGWMQDLDAFWGEEWLQTTHEYLANTLIGAAVIHVCAVLLIQWRLRVPLIQSMLTLSETTPSSTACRSKPSRTRSGANS